MLIKTGIFLPEPRKTNVSSQEKNNKPPKKPHTANRLDLTDNFWKIEVFSSSFICLIIENETKTSNSEERGISETERLPVVSVFDAYPWLSCVSCYCYSVCLCARKWTFHKKAQIWSAKCAKQGARNVNESFTAHCLKQSIMTEHWQLSPWGGTNTQANQMEPLPWNRCHDNDLFA